MKKTTSISTLISVIFIALSVASGTANARAEKEVCTKPRFTKFKPGKLEEVAPESEFYFLASGYTAPRSVVVEVKNIEVDMDVEDKGTFYKFTGKLPASLKGTYARIQVKGKAKLGCRGTGGVLLKISGGADVAKEESTEAEGESKNTDSANSE